MRPHLFVLGPGYTATPLIEHALSQEWYVTATVRSETQSPHSPAQAMPYETVDFSAGRLTGSSPVTHVLSSIAPNETGDPALEKWGQWIQAQTGLHSLHYLSSTNVYGDHGGAWVDETTPPQPSLPRGQHRLAAENAWQTLAAAMQTPLFIYRLSGIYGPQRNALKTVMSGRARRIIKAGQQFGRIHVGDIKTTLWAAMIGTHGGGIFNLSDDLPAPPQNVIETAAKLLGQLPPAEETFETADMSAVARSFYAENKRVKNDKVKAELGVKLAYPTYKEGLTALLKSGAD